MKKEPLIALRAIQARIDGVFDNPDLLAFGPLSTSIVKDCKRIVKETLEAVDEKEAD